MWNLFGEPLDVNRLLENIFDNSSSKLSYNVKVENMTGPMIKTSSEGYELEFEVPGCSAEHLLLRFAGTTLSVGYQRGKKAGATTYRLPADADLSKAKSSVKDGLLTLTVPKKTAESADGWTKLEIG